MIGLLFLGLVILYLTVSVVFASIRSSQISREEENKDE